MLDHESQRLLRSAFITGSFDPLTALSMMVTEITEFHPYCISDVSHFYALSFHLVFIALTLPLHSLFTEYQISSFNYSFTKGFPTLSKRQSLHHGGKTTKQPTKKTEKPRTARKHQGWGTEIYPAPELDLPALPWSNLLLTPNQDCVTS